MHVLNEAFAPSGMAVCFMAEYWLPDVDALKVLPCSYETKIMEQKEFQKLYHKQWSNALCEDRKELDVLGAGAWENDRLIALAACSADCDSMWQIGKVPFYCCAWSNIKSARNAIKSGFRPAWAELTVKPKKLVDEMNRTDI